jgi:hypothetical protein
MSDLSAMLITVTAWAESTGQWRAAWRLARA